MFQKEEQNIIENPESDQALQKDEVKIDSIFSNDSSENDNKSNSLSAPTDNQEQHFDSDSFTQTRNSNSLLLKQRIYQEVFQLSQPFWFSKLVTNYYWIVTLVVLLIQIVSVVIAIKFTLFSTYNLQPRDFFVSSDIRTQRLDVENAIFGKTVSSTTQLQKEIQSFKDVLDQEGLDAIIKGMGDNNQAYNSLVKNSIGNRLRNLQDHVRNSIDYSYSLQILYTCNENCKTIFTRQNVEKMILFESSLQENHLWNQICYSESTTNSKICPSEAYNNFTRIFYKPYLNGTLTDDYIQSILNKIADDNSLYVSYRGTLSKEFSNLYPFSDVYSTNFKIGRPQYDENGKVLTNSKMNEIGRSFCQHAYDLSESVSSDDFQIIAICKAVGEQILLDQIYHDMKLCFACLGFIWLYVTFHLRSLFLSTVSMINIASSVPIAIIVYKLIIGIPFFSLLHILVFLIILGIGADNTFLFNDTWILSGQIVAIKHDYNKRVAYTFRKASKAIIATSITNFVAFLGTCFSSIMPISAFGIYAIIVVPLGYFFIIGILPSQYLFYDKHVKQRFKWRSLFKICKRKRPSVEQQTHQEDERDKNNNVDKLSEEFIEVIPNERQQESDQIFEQKSQSSQEAKDTDQNNQLEQEQPQNMITQRPVISIDLSQRTSINSINTQLHFGARHSTDFQRYVNDKQLKQKKEKGNNIPKKLDLTNGEINSQGEAINYDDYIRTKRGCVEKLFEKYISKFVYKFKVVLLIIASIWLGISIWRASLIESVSYNEQFFSSSIPAQKAIDIIQNKLYTEDGVYVNFYFGLEPQLQKFDNVSKWNSNYQGEPVFTSNFDLSKEESQLSLLQLCQQFPKFKQTYTNQVTGEQSINCFMTNFKSWVELQGQSFPVPQALFKLQFAKWLLSGDAQAEQHLRNLDIGIFNYEVKYVRLRVRSYGQTYDGYSVKYPIYEDWEELMARFHDKAPIQLRGFQTAGDDWCWIITERAFFSNAIHGLLLSLAFALGVLIIATHNIIVSLLSVLIIACVLSSVVGIIQLIGWKLGVAVSLGMDFFVGFSVDYIVHVAHEFVDSFYNKRQKRVDSMYQNIGVAVFSGAVTTFLSATFLLFTKIVALQKFGILIQMTILFSLLYALIIMPALFYVFGPQYRQGDLKFYIWQPLMKRLRCFKHKNDGPQKLTDNEVYVINTRKTIKFENQISEEEVSTSKYFEENLDSSQSENSDKKINNINDTKNHQIQLQNKEKQDKDLNFD